MKTILILTHSFPPKNIVGALRPFRFAKYISGRGWKPVIVTHSATEKSALDFSLLQELSQGTQIHYLFNSKPLIISEKIRMKDIIENSGFKFTRKNRLKNKLMLRALGTGRDLLNRALLPDIDVIWTPFFIKKAVNILNNANSKVILTTSPPHSIHLAGLIVAVIKQIPWVADFRDPWDKYPLTGHYDLANPLERRLEKAVIKRADAVISSTKTNTKNLIKKHKDIAQEKFFTITNAFDKEKFSMPVVPDPDKFIISYTGIFYVDKDPFTFFRALHSWFSGMSDDKRQKYKKILEVKLIGSQKSIADKVRKYYGLEEVVHIIGRVPHKESIQLISSSDMLLMAYGLGRQARPGCLPSKVFEYLGCRIPILAITREGELANLIRETNSGYVVTSENHREIHTILETEIHRKFSNNSWRNKNKFRFEGVEKFEERFVCSDMINLIEKLI